MEQLVVEEVEHLGVQRNKSLVGQVEMGMLK